MKTKFMIKDWAGNDLTYHHGEFESFDHAEDHLSEFLGDSYEKDRQEYDIIEIASYENQEDYDADETLGHSSRHLAIRNGYINNI